MKKLLLLTAALAIAAPAQAQSLWPVRTADGSCSMSQTFESADFGRTTLRVAYDAAKQEVTLTSTNPMVEQLPGTGEILWTVVFLDNGDNKFDDGWAARSFSYAKDGDRYRFSTAFAGENNVRQILADLGASSSIGFMRQGKLVTAYELEGARSSVAQLQDCAARAIASNGN